MHDRSITLLNNQGLDQHGGGVRILDCLARHFARRNDVRIVAESMAADRDLQQSVVPPVPKARASWRWQPFRRVRHLARVVPPLLAGAAADVVICLDPHFVTAVRKIRPRLCAYVSLSAVPRQEWFSERGTTALSRALQYAWIERCMFKRAECHVVASQLHAREIRRFELMRTFRPLVLPPVFALQNAVATSKKHPSIVLVVARLIALKNVKGVITIAERLRDVDCRFVIVGDGDQRAELEQRARPLGERVHFAGAVEAQPFYREAKVLLHLSRYESFGISVVEAMQHGVVPLCGAPGPRCVTATAEIVADGVSGLLCDLDDAGQMERALRDLLGDHARWAALSAGARARAAELLRRDYAHEFERALDGAGR